MVVMVVPPSEHDTGLSDTQKQAEFGIMVFGVNKVGRASSGKTTDSKFESGIVTDYKVLGM